MSSIASSEIRRVARPVRIWLFVGVILVFIQVVLGGITRLTDSGLSITEWEIIQGVFPPLNEQQWEEAFDKYKVAARKQYESLHADMTLSEFKWIYFWEYFHRLWARMMGLVFIIPFIYFFVGGRISSWLMRRLVIVVGLAALAAIFGWIMVDSGLNNNNRTWVSAYKLAGHLAIATILFGYLFWTWLKSNQPITEDGSFNNLRRRAWLITWVVSLQIILGGLMAGMKAGLIHPHFPYFVAGEQFYNALFSSSELDAAEMVVNYEPSIKIKAWVQLLHRGTAYLLVALIIQFFIRAVQLKISLRLRIGIYILAVVLLAQFLLGILTVINSIGHIPITYGALHQAFALILLAAILYIDYQFTSPFP